MKKLNLYNGPISPNICARCSAIKITCQVFKIAKLLSSGPHWGVSGTPSRVLHAPGTSLYPMVPKHLRITWSRPEQSHLLLEACSSERSGNRRQRQRQTKRPPPELSMKVTICRDIVRVYRAFYSSSMLDCIANSLFFTLTLSLPGTRICVNFSTVYNDTLVAKGLIWL